MTTPAAALEGRGGCLVTVQMFRFSIVSVSAGRAHDP